MTSASSAQEYLPTRLTLPALRRAAASCKGCELYKRATQTVFGAGPTSARVVFIGEMPGDREDRQGQPFVGPAGRLLDEVIAAAGLERDAIYVTNAVKHFQWEVRGKRRLHKKPRWRHVQACKPWLNAKITVINLRLIVCLGATAAQAVLGPDFRITRERGRVLNVPGLPAVMATYHPAAILRAPEKEDRDRMGAGIQGRSDQRIQELEKDKLGIVINGPPIATWRR